MSAPKGNKNAVGNNGGRPPLYKSVEEIQEKIDQYFLDCDNNTEEVFDKALGVVTVKKPLPYTIEGLGLALGFCSRKSFMDYEDKIEFVNTIKKAKYKCLNNKLNGAMIGKYNPTITIFDLKNNHDFRDVKEHDHTTGGKPFDSIKVIIEEVSANGERTETEDTAITETETGSQDNI